MTTKRFGYKSTEQTRAQARSVIAHVEGRVKEPIGFKKRLILDPASIRQVRKGLDLTQKEFAALLGVELVTVESWEGGRRIADGPVTNMILLLARYPQLKKWLADLGLEAELMRSRQGSGPDLGSVAASLKARAKGGKDSLHSLSQASFDKGAEIP
jgi:DNA-binding transcriptional regulator YiaG